MEASLSRRCLSHWLPSLQSRCGLTPLRRVFSLVLFFTFAAFTSPRTYAALSPDLSTESLRFLAGQGNAEAMNYLGYSLISDGTDPEEGLRWLEKAAGMGDVKAASNVGWLLLNGEQVPQDLDKAVFWLTKAADGGLPVARSILGDLYRDGRGVQADTAKADSLYRAAYEGGLADAAYKLAALNADRYEALSPEEAVKEGKYFYYGAAPSEGVKLFYQAADAGNAEAMALLGDAYTRAVGVPYDHDLSLQYYARAAQAGNPAAQFILAELLEIFPDALSAIGVTDNSISSSLYWYEKAAAAGITSAEEAAASLR